MVARKDQYSTARVFFLNKDDFSEAQYLFAKR